MVGSSNVKLTLPVTYVNRENGQNIYPPTLQHDCRLVMITMHAGETQLHYTLFLFTINAQHFYIYFVWEV